MTDSIATTSRRTPRHRNRRRRKKFKEGTDTISSLPDAILQHILSSLYTNDAIRTSTLSKRWRHVWCGTPCLRLDSCNVDINSINQTLTQYTAPKRTSFRLCASEKEYLPHFDRWIELAISRKVESLSLSLTLNKKINVPDYLYCNSSLKELKLWLYSDMNMIPLGVINWPLLKKLSLHGCCLSEESFAKVINGCPLLETLSLHLCFEIVVLDVSKSVNLRTLEIEHHHWLNGPTQIIAPQIHCLVMKIVRLPCSLADVSSLIEARVNVHCRTFETTVEAEFAQAMVLEMLVKLRNVERLTLGGNFLQVLSLGEIRGLHFPMLKVKDLTLETSVARYVVPGVERMLRNSPCLKRIMIHKRHCNGTMVEYLDGYLVLKGLDPEQCWRSEGGICLNMHELDVKGKDFVSFMEFVLKNARGLEKVVVRLEDDYRKFKKLVPTISHNNNVSIVLLKPVASDVY